MTALDKATREQFLVAWRSSRRLARDFAEYLNQVGLLLTPARRRDLLAKELRKVAAELENANPTFMVEHFYGSTSMTALDMQRAVTSWLRLKADEVEEER